MKIRGHLRACAGCRDFEAALHQRPAQLTALATPLPLAIAASILHGLLAGGGPGSGGGLLAALGISAKGLSGASLATKIATVSLVAGTIGNSAAVTLPALDSPTPDRAAASTRSNATGAPAPRPAAAPRLRPRHHTQGRSRDHPRSQRHRTGRDDGGHRYRRWRWQPRHDTQRARDSSPSEHHLS